MVSELGEQEKAVAGSTKIQQRKRGSSDNNRYCRLVQYRKLTGKLQKKGGEGET